MSKKAWAKEDIEKTLGIKPLGELEFKRLYEGNFDQVDRENALEQEQKELILLTRRARREARQNRELIFCERN